MRLSEGLGSRVPQCPLGLPLLGAVVYGAVSVAFEVPPSRSGQGAAAGLSGTRLLRQVKVG